MGTGLERYRLGPFLLESEIPIPELAAAGGQVLASVPELSGVSIRLGAVPERLEGVIANESRWWASRDQYLLRVPRVAEFLVGRGREVTVAPAQGALAADIRAYLLSPVFSMLCYQAGMVALHASSVQVGDGVVAFLGDSGAGKSTLAAHLDRRGYAVVSDDICLLDARLAVVPVAPALKLWRSALEQMGGVREDMPRVFSGEAKYRVPTRSSDVRLPLRKVVFLEWGDDGESFAEGFAPVKGVDAVARLMQFTHYDYLMKAMGRQQASFLQCGQILKQVGANVLRRPRDFARIDRVVDGLEEHLRTG
jgi:hypothetical protein